MRKNGAVLPQLQQAGEPPPPASIEPPAGRWDSFYSAAYHDLDTDRPVNGWVIAPIPRSKIAEYGREQGLRGDVLHAFVFVIRQMDNAYLAWEREEAKSRKPPPS